MRAVYVQLWAFINIMVLLGLINKVSQGGAVPVPDTFLPVVIGLGLSALVPYVVHVWRS